MSVEQLTIAMMRIVIDKSIDHAKPHLICVFTTILRSIEIFCLSASSKKHCVTHYREKHCFYSCQQQQLSQSDWEISSKCGKNKDGLLI